MPLARVPGQFFDALVGPHGRRGRLCIGFDVPVSHLKDHPADASDRYARDRNAPKALADQVAACLAHALSPDSRGSGGDPVAAVAGNWKFMTESGAVPASTRLNIEDVIDARFLPSR